MKAVIHTENSTAWADMCGNTPWPLLTFGNRTLFEYWLEWCVELGIADVRIVLGEGSEQIESYAGDGSRWGLDLDYSFFKGVDKTAFLRRSPQTWIDEGVMHVCEPLFPAKISLAENGGSALSGKCFVVSSEERAAFFLSVDPDLTKCYITNNLTLKKNEFDSCKFLGRRPEPICKISDFFDLNMRLVRGDIENYLKPGYFFKNRAGIGYNVITPATASLDSPLLIGNNCRLGPLSKVGPGAVIGSNVIIDRQTEVSDAVILGGTYIGRGMEIKSKIVSGNIVIDPYSEIAVTIPDPWMVGGVKSGMSMNRLFCFLFSIFCALIVCALQTVPFLVLFPRLYAKGCRFKPTKILGRSRRKEIDLFVFDCRKCSRSLALRLFRVFGLDLYPGFFQAARARLWTCGHTPVRMAESDKHQPAYFPGVISYEMNRALKTEPDQARVDFLYYSYHRSPAEDLKIIFHFVLRRWKDFLGLSQEKGACNWQ